MRRPLAIAVAAALLVACSSDPDTEAGEDEAVEAVDDTLPAPEGLPEFYAVPDPIPDADPGTIVRTEPMEVDEISGTVERVMYTSTAIDGSPIVVTGMVAVPDASPPADGYPVLAWAHGTTGIADVCAPSLEGPDAVPIVDQLLDAGFVVAATDYEGLGTPGRHAYIVGESEARGVLDSVRAAGQLDGVELSGRYAVWGHSQGGHAAMYTLHRAGTYAPELDLVGVVAGAPPSQLDLLYAALQASPFRYYLLMAAAGFNAAYGDEAAPLGDVLTPTGVEAIDLVDEGCDVGAATADLDLDSLLLADPSTVPAWNTILRDNDPGRFTEPSAVPLLVIHGGADEQIPVAASALMFDQLCAIGQDQTRWVYPGQSHAGVIGPSVDDMLTWIDHRFAGEPSPDAMTPSGQPDVETQRCPTA